MQTQRTADSAADSRYQARTATANSDTTKTSKNHDCVSFAIIFIFVACSFVRCYLTRVCASDASAVRVALIVARATEVV